MWCTRKAFGVLGNVPNDQLVTGQAQNTQHSGHLHWSWARMGSFSIIHKLVSYLQSTRSFQILLWKKKYPKPVLFSDAIRTELIAEEHAILLEHFSVHCVFHSGTETVKHMEEAQEMVTDDN